MGAHTESLRVLLRSGFQFEGAMIFVYAFAGPSRRSDVSHCIGKILDKIGLQLRFFGQDYDTERSTEHDFTNKDFA